MALRFIVTPPFPWEPPITRISKVSRLELSRGRLVWILRRAYHAGGDVKTLRQKASENAKQKVQMRAPVCRRRRSRSKCCLPRLKKASMGMRLPCAGPAPDRVRAEAKRQAPSPLRVIELRGDDGLMFCRDSDGTVRLLHPEGETEIISSSDE